MSTSWAWRHYDLDRLCLKNSSVMGTWMVEEMCCCFEMELVKHDLYIMKTLSHINLKLETSKNVY